MKAVGPTISGELLSQSEGEWSNARTNRRKNELPNERVNQKTIFPHAIV
jgi:hypothetical protein